MEGSNGRRETEVRDGCDSHRRSSLSRRLGASGSDIRKELMVQERGEVGKVSSELS